MNSDFSCTDDLQTVSVQLLTETTVELQALVLAGVSANAECIANLVCTLGWLLESVFRTDVDELCGIPAGNIGLKPSSPSLEFSWHWAEVVVAYLHFSHRWQSASVIAAAATEFGKESSLMLPSLIQELRACGQDHLRMRQKPRKSYRLKESAT